MKRLTVAERREADARMQKRLNLSRIHRVHRAALQSGWYAMSFDNYCDLPSSMVTDYGDRIEVQYPEGGLFTVADFDGETVVLRKVA